MGGGGGRGVECLCLGLLVVAAAARVLLGRLVGAPHRRAAVGRGQRADQRRDGGERGVVREREARAPPGSCPLFGSHVALVHRLRRLHRRDDAERAGLVVLEAVPVLAEVVVVVPPLLAIIIEPLVVVPVAQRFRGTGGVVVAAHQFERPAAVRAVRAPHARRHGRVVAVITVGVIIVVAVVVLIS